MQGIQQVVSNCLVTAHVSPRSCGGDNGAGGATAATVDGQNPALPIIRNIP